MQGSDRALLGTALQRSGTNLVSESYSVKFYFKSWGCKPMMFLFCEGWNFSLYHDKVMIFRCQDEGEGANPTHACPSTQ